MRKFTLQTGLIAASLLATSIASANIGFGQSLNNFTFDSDYQGTFTYGGNTYGAGNTINLTSLAPDLANGATGYFYKTNTNFQTYRIYRQNHSAVIGNIVRGDADRSFVRDIAGSATPDTIKNTAATYTYEGVVFNHIPGTEGDLDYTVNVSNTGVVTGQGSISGVTGARPGVGNYTLGGTLDKVTFTASGGKLNSTTGTATLTLTDSLGAINLQDTRYDIGVYGPNAEEVAGGLYTKVGSTAPTGETLQGLVGGYGFAGEKVSTTTP